MNVNVSQLLSSGAALLIVAALAITTVEPVSTQGSLPTTLVRQADMTYLGGFDLPDAAGAGDRRCFEYQYPGAMGYNPATHSLIVKSHDWDEGWAGEVNIPANVSGTATVRQPCRDITEGRIRQINGGGNRVHIGGFLVKGTDLLISAFPYYANGTGDGTHMSRSTNFADTAVRGPVRVGSTSSGTMGGYMAHIPSEWQTALKGDMLTGQCCISIISRSSFGPSISSAWFTDVLTQSRPTATTLVNYPSANPLAPYGTSTPSELWNGYTRIRGVVLPAGTASVLFVGRHGTGRWCYGTGAQCNDPIHGDQGEHAYPYRAQVWAYDAHDLAAVAAGTREPHTLRPYAVWALPGISGFEIAGAVMDANGRLYVLEHGGGPGPRGRVHVYSVRGSGASTPAADTTAPTVTLTNTAGTVRGTVTLSATASDNQGVTSVWFTVNDAPVGSEDTTAPYQATWNTTTLANGNYTVRALARDAAGNTGRSAAVTLTVDNSTAADTTAPSVGLTAPAAGASVSGTVTVSANASDNVGVSSVQFTLNGVNLGSPDATAPYAVNWNTTSAADGAYELRAIARDAAGNATTSASRRVTVTNRPSTPTADTQRPTVSITSPSGGRVSGTIQIRASASDNVGVARVTIAVDGTTIATLSGTGPYTTTWNTTRFEDGAHRITVTATDAAGNSRATSVSVTVNNRSGSGSGSGNSNRRNWR